MANQWHFWIQLILPKWRRQHQHIDCDFWSDCIWNFDGNRIRWHFRDFNGAFDGGRGFISLRLLQRVAHSNSIFSIRSKLKRSINRLSTARRFWIHCQVLPPSLIERALSAPRIPRGLVERCRKNGKLICIFFIFPKTKSDKIDNFPVWMQQCDNATKQHWWKLQDFPFRTNETATYWPVFQLILVKFSHFANENGMHWMNE